MSSEPHPVPSNWQLRAEPLAPGPAVVFDMDGVLSDASGRQWYLERPRRDWEGFFEACGDDDLIDPVARLLELLDDDLVVVLLTARPLRVQGETLDWLARHKLGWDILIMRDFGDYGASRRFKQRTVSELRRHGFELSLALEDDRRNVEMFEDEGVPCLYVHSGYYD